MARKRDYFRLNKQDQQDLYSLLLRNVFIPKVLREHGRPHDDDCFYRLYSKFMNRLALAGAR